MLAYLRPANKSLSFMHASAEGNKSLGELLLLHSVKNVSYELPADGDRTEIVCIARNQLGKLLQLDDVNL